MEIIVEIAQNSRIWKDRKEISKKSIKNLTSATLSKLEFFKGVEICEVSVLLSNSAEIRKLNKEFRGKDEDTNVLSFPDEPMYKGSFKNGTPPPGYLYIGDIAYSYEKIEEEAELAGISFFERFSHLTVHSILHLVGFDHGTEQEASEMENLETEILEESGINSPYAE